jgi:hypothetical protein
MAIQREPPASEPRVKAFLERIIGIDGVLAIDASGTVGALEGWHVLVDSENAQVAVIEAELAEFHANLDFPVEVHSYVVEGEDAVAMKDAWADSPSLLYIRR